VFFNCVVSSLILVDPFIDFDWIGSSLMLIVPLVDFDWMTALQFFEFDGADC